MSMIVNIPSNLTQYSSQHNIQGSFMSMLVTIPSDVTEYAGQHYYFVGYAIQLYGMLVSMLSDLTESADQHNIQGLAL